LRFTFDDREKQDFGKKCVISVSGRYSYSGSEVTQIPIGTPTVSGPCYAIPGSKVTFDYTVENNGMVSLKDKTSTSGCKSGCIMTPKPDACPPARPDGTAGNAGAGIAIDVSVLVSVLGVLGVAILGFVCWRRKRARMTERGGQMISYDMGMHAAFISAAQPSSQSPVVAVNMPATTPAAASQAPLINTIPTTSPVFGADGKPIIINTIPTTSPVFGVDGKPIIINTIPTTTPVFGADGKPVFHNHVVLDLD
jgi:hypothetical protein